MTLFRAQGLTAGYGPVTVLHSIDVEVNEGEIVVMLGANGAGKTTTMRAISGVIPRQGIIELEGRSIQKAGPDVIVRGGVAQVPQGRGTFPELSVEDNLRAGAYIRRDGSASVTADINKWFGVFPRLAERRTQRAGSLSGGEQQMLAIGRGLMAEPRLLILDEPSLGLSPLLVEEMFALIRQLQRSGLAILLVEQNVGQSLEIADRAYVMENGLIRFSGTPAQLLGSDDLRRAYLGL